MATIFCFSSTGNSLYTAKRIAEKIDGRVVSMSSPPSKCEDDVVGFVFPVYFWGLPRIVKRYVRELQLTNRNAYVFAVATYGGKVYGVLGELKSLLSQKGITLHYGRNLKSVENYIPGYKINDNEAFRQSIDDNILEIADEISGARHTKIQNFTVLNKLIHGFYPNANSDQFFAVSDTCTGCGVCQKICPVNNISMEHRRPTFEHGCEHCLACIHNCPANAIGWKQKTEGKGQYRNHQIKLDDLISFVGKEDSPTA